MRRNAWAAVVVMVACLGGGRVVGQGLENFDNFPETGSTYKDGTFTGQDGSTWTYSQCRGDKPITAPTPCLGRDRTPAAELRSGLIAGGIGTLSFDWMKAFSSDVNLEVYVNDSLVHTVTGGTLGVPQSEGPITVEVGGDFTLKFLQKSGGGPVSLDNVAWTAHGGGPATTNIRFSAATAAAQTETGEPSVTVDVTISASTDASVGITSVGTAALGSDFTLSSDSFVFIGGGAVSKTLTVTVLDDEEEEGTETVTLVLTNAVGAELGAPAEFSFDIKDNDFGGEPGGLETFANFPETGVTYKDGTFTGQDGSTWTYVQCRGDKLIAAPTPCLGMDRTPNAELYSGTITGGIGILTFDWMKAFASAVDMEVYVNAERVHTVTGGTQGVPQSEGPITVEIGGDFVLRFVQKAGGGQVSIDNVAWTLHAGAAPTNMRFSASSAASQAETGGPQVTVDVQISAPADASVDIGSTGTATLGSDFTLSTDRVVFAAGGAQTQTVTITVLDDGDPEPPETVALALVNATGATLGLPFTFGFTITDDDSGPVVKLFISEVADPADNANARFVELYNAEAAAIDLGAGPWYLARQANGGTWGDIALTGSVAAAETYVVAYSASNFLVAYGMDAQQASGFISGNGNDGYFLYKGGNHAAGILADAYGVVDQDGTGEAWEYTDARAERKANITAPNPVWTTAEWTLTSPANAADMTPGDHTVSGGGPEDDDDGDGMPNGWEALYFGGPTNATAGADPDGDRHNNWQEWVAGTDPTNTLSVLRVNDSAAGAGAAWVLTWSSTSNRLYSVQWSSNLRAGFATVVSNLEATPAVNVYTDATHAAGHAGMYRIGVTNP